MQLLHFSDLGAFRDAAEPFLVRHEARNNLILGLITGLQEGRFQQHPPYMACGEHQGEVILVALRTPPYKLNLAYVEPQHRTAATFQPLVDDIRATYETIPGINGMAVVTAPFIEQYQSASGAQYRVAMKQRCFKLERVIPVRGVPGTMRRAAIDDRERIIDWQFAFVEEIWGDPLGQGEIEPGIMRRLEAQPEQAGFVIWEVEGQAVSMAGYTGRTPNGMRVNAVYTPPELRKRGYATAVTAALSQMLLDSGRKFCFLFTDAANPTSNKIYEAIGYEWVSNVNDYALVED